MWQRWTGWGGKKNTMISHYQERKDNFTTKDTKSTKFTINEIQALRVFLALYSNLDISITTEA